VRHAGEHATVRPGDPVAGIVPYGAFAELVSARPHAVVPLPEGTPFEVGAALPINYLTAHFALSRRAGLRADETVLVHGAAGGIGTATIQIARAMGATVIGVVSSAQKHDIARGAGAHHVVSSASFRTEVAELTSGRGVEVVVDPVGGDRFTDSLRCLGTEGRLLVIGFTAGEIPSIRVNRLLLSNTDVRGVAWGAYAMARPGFMREQWTELSPLLRSGAVDPVIGAVHDLDKAREALAALEARHAVGKIVLKVV
jgi:NADPH2:quinone reductase